MVRTLLEDLEDALDLEQATAESDPSKAIELREFLRHSGQQSAIERSAKDKKAN